MDDFLIKVHLLVLNNTFAVLFLELVIGIPVLVMVKTWPSPPDWLLLMMPGLFFGVILLDILSNEGSIRYNRRANSQKIQ